VELFLSVTLSFQTAPHLIRLFTAGEFFGEEFRPRCAECQSE
jgi:hypothetical protein